MPAFRVIELGPGGHLEVFEGPEHVRRPPAGVALWIDLRAADAETLELLREKFDFHPLAIEDCAQFDQRPKLEEYRDHLFLVTQGFTCLGARVEELELHEVHAFIGDRYLVTVHADEVPAMEGAWKRVATDKRPLERGVDFVYYLIADAVVDSNFPILDLIADELEQLEDKVL
jgi:magnesium transporter